MDSLWVNHRGAIHRAGWGRGYTGRVTRHALLRRRGHVHAVGVERCVYVAGFEASCLVALPVKYKRTLDSIVV